jgi:1,4-dihydroxy-2-naphthoyl-CoA hydrolase
MDMAGRVDPEQTTTLHGLVPFAALLGVEVVGAGAGEVRARIAWQPDRCTAGGVLHGGVLMGLADTCGAWCAFLNLPEGASGTTTIESKSNFFRAVRHGYIEAVARPLHVGRSTIVVETDLRDASGRHVARVAQTQAVLRPDMS